MSVWTTLLVFMSSVFLPCVYASCQPPPCFNGATCLPDNDDFRCVCLPGYTGRLCRINIFDCTGNPCNHRGVCVDLLNDFRCDCHPGFTGRNCETKIDQHPCATRPCQNGATCSRFGRQGDYYCTCPSGFTGKDCSQPEPVTTRAGPPKSGAVIMPCDDGGECHCSVWYAGRRCSQISGLGITLLILGVIFIGAIAAIVTVAMIRRKARRISQCEVLSTQTSPDGVACISESYLTLVNSCENLDTCRASVRVPPGQVNIYETPPDVVDSHVDYSYDNPDAIYQTIDEVCDQTNTQKADETRGLSYENPEEDYLIPSKEENDETEEDYLVPSREGSILANGGDKVSPGDHPPKLPRSRPDRVGSDLNPVYENQTAFNQESFDDTAPRAGNEYDSADPYSYTSLPLKK